MVPCDNDGSPDEVPGNLWSFGDSEESSFSNNFHSLQITSSSIDSSDSLTSRGFGKKSKSGNTIPSNTRTSKYLLQFLINENENVSGGESASISPTTELPIGNSCASGSSASHYYEIVQVPPIQNSLPIQMDPCIDITGPHSDLSNVSEQKKHHKDIKKRLVKHLMSKLKNKPNSGANQDQFIDEYGDTALMQACRSNRVENVLREIECLIREQHISLIDHTNRANETALSIAVHQMNDKMLTLLLQNHASPTVPLLMGNNVLHVAAALMTDPPRHIFCLLLRLIGHYQQEKLIETLATRNLFNFDPSSVLEQMLHISSAMPNCVPDSGQIRALLRHIKQIFMTYDSIGTVYR